jgi:hypothetical protein
MNMQIHTHTHTHTHTYKNVTVVEVLYDDNYSDASYGYEVPGVTLLQAYVCT